MAERLLVDRDLLTVMEQMWEAREKWYYIGLYFEIPPSQLDVIKSESKDDIDEMFTKMIKQWLQVGHCCNWKTVYDALKSPTVSKESTAEKLSEWFIKGRKRKATSQDGSQSKKFLLDEPGISRSPACPTEISGYAATYNNVVYFQSGGIIYEFDTGSRNWTRSIECPHIDYGFSIMGNELVAVGGRVKSDKSPTNKVLCFPLENSSTRERKGKNTRSGKSKAQKQVWEDKYPKMNEKRVYPNVLVYEKFLIVIGGFMHIQNEVSRKISRKAMISMEILNVEEKCWYFNDKINLPQEFSTMKWLSACICGKDLYITAKHNDPKFEATVGKIVNDDWRRHEDGYDEYADVVEKYEEDIGGPYPCYSFYRCSVDTLLRISKEGNYENDVAESKFETIILWQRLQHPHHSVYLNLKPEVVNGDIRHEEEAAYLYYGACCFTLSSVNNELVAVGCQHIQSIPNEHLRALLYIAYKSYGVERNTQKQVFGYDSNLEASIDEETIDYECHIYRYDAEADYWELVKSTPPNGESSSGPSVAVVDEKLVIARASHNVIIVPYP
ncbi:hypothetical protein GBAR_LOCUS15059 [Geodia barretti]|nr:hypothetical protein GBAR_LOCUS15059 [Geodia barretti]